MQDEDEAEERRTNDFIVKGCSLGPKKPACSKYFSCEEVSTTQMNCREMSATELEMLMLANLEAHQHNLEKIHGVSKNTGLLIPTCMGNEGSMRDRVSIDYYFCGKWVFKCSFMLVRGVEKKTFQEHGLVPHD